MTQPEQPEPERPKAWQPTWVSNDELTFLGPIPVDDADFDTENASIDVVATGEDHD